MSRATRRRGVLQSLTTLTAVDTLFRRTTASAAEADMMRIRANLETLTAEQVQAFGRLAKRRMAGVPMRVSAYRLCRDVGLPKGEARTIVDRQFPRPTVDASPTKQGEDSP